MGFIFNTVLCITKYYIIPLFLFILYNASFWGKLLLFITKLVRFYYFHNNSYLTKALSCQQTFNNFTNTITTKII